MIVNVALEYRFSMTPDGFVWTDGAFARSFWDRYLEVFAGVRVIARVKPLAAPPAGHVRADGDGVVFSRVPCYIGPSEYLRNARAVRRSVLKGVGPTDAVILRVPSQLSAILSPKLLRSRHPYGVEVLADPHDVFAPGAVRHPLRPFFRRWFARKLRRHCRHACAAAYVTANALQRRYPSDPSAYSVHYSDVQLDGKLLSQPRSPARKRSWSLVTIGSLAQLYKGQDVQIDAVVQCQHAGLDVSLTIVGDGKHRTELEQRAVALGVADRVHFRGQLPAGKPIRDELDGADLFLLPSRTEGLPRAMVEAMARGLPCIGSRVGGIPELLPDEDLVPPGDADALYQMIRKVLSDPARMREMSARNLRRAHDFQEEVLRERRIAFYRFIRERTEDYITTTNTPSPAVLTDRD